MRIIAGTARGRTIESPPGRHTRPTLDRVRENLFNMIQHEVPSARVLDLFAGTGALAFEALSRGAASALLGDNDRTAHRVQVRNAETLGFSDRTEILLCDWRQTLSRAAGQELLFDIVFLDPPYSMKDLREVFASLDSVTDKDTLIILEHEGKEQVIAGDGYDCFNERKWGYCAVSFYRKRQDGDPAQRRVT